jgi:hypothetical protein
MSNRRRVVSLCEHCIRQKDREAVSCAIIPEKAEGRITYAEMFCCKIVHVLLQNFVLENSVCFTAQLCMFLLQSCSCFTAEYVQPIRDEKDQPKKNNMWRPCFGPPPAPWANAGIESAVLLRQWYRPCSTVFIALRFGTQGPRTWPFPQSMLHASSWLLNEAKSF